MFQKLGEFSFQVYLWRWPLFATIKWYKDGELKRGWMALQWKHFVPATIVLYGISYMWYAYVDSPIRRYLVRRATRTSFQQQDNNSMGAELIDHPSSSENDDTPKVTGENAPSASYTWRTGELT
jgi:peptidoglycan/LPS O-acetylase OafA/YrhL